MCFGLCMPVLPVQLWSMWQIEAELQDVLRPLYACFTFAVRGHVADWDSAGVGHRANKKKIKKSENVIFFCFCK